jgi:hypothetical protein
MSRLNRTAAAVDETSTECTPPAFLIDVGPIAGDRSRGALSV